IQEVTPTEVIQDQEGSEKASDEVSTAGAKKDTTAEEVPIWDEEERKRAIDEAKTTKKIDWNDPSVIRYHSLKMKPKTIAQARRNMIKYLKNQGNFKISDFKGMSYNDIRTIFEKIWDFNQNIEPMDTDHGSGKQKSPQKSPEKSPEKVVEEEIDTQEELTEGVKEPGAKRKKSIPRKSTRKRQKLEEDAEKDELKGFLDIVPREEAPIEVESISTKFPIVDWKTCVLTETFMYYQVFKGDGSSKNYKILSEMLEDFDRLDVEELFRLVKERYSTSRPEGFDLCFGEIYMFYLKKKYPLSQEMISKMLKKKLEVDHESSQAIELLRIDQGVGSTRYNTNDNASPLGKETHNPKTVICANSSSLSAGTKDGVAASFQQSRIHYHMLMLKQQRHTISIKIQESRKLKFKDKDFRKL
ncbi:hypothetical protein Tco_1404581, partial [Tanacetum coccineum]